jgi:DNA-directed RNA polymerase subunit RPC12/RpoP
MKAGEKHRTPPKQQVAGCVQVPVLMTVVSCPACGAGVDLWTGEEETRCFACDHAIFRIPRFNH